jgi:hypothetical protein
VPLPLEFVNFRNDQSSSEADLNGPELVQAAA